MYIYILQFILFFLIYVFLDYILGEKVQGKYYLLHSINNTLIVYSTLPDLLYTYSNFFDYYNYDCNYFPSIISYSLHFYHIFVYFKKMRFDDWLHHIIMMFTLPLALATDPGSLLNHAMFYLTGLPGAINYSLLFLCRNGFVSKIFQKQINNYLNLLIRCPGCLSHVTMSLLTLGFRDFTPLQTYFVLIQCLIVYWNGIYFMNQVVVDYNKQITKKKLKIN